MAIVAQPGVLVGRGPRSRGGGSANWANRDRRVALTMLAPNFILFSIFVGIPVIGGLLLSFFNWGLVGWPQWAGSRQLPPALPRPHRPGSHRQHAALRRLRGGADGGPRAVARRVHEHPGPGDRRHTSAVFCPGGRIFCRLGRTLAVDLPPETGLLDYLLALVGVNGPAWLSNTTLALPALDIIGIWLTLPISIILYLAALQRIPESTLEAATLDGAGAYRRLVHIIWPSVRPMTVLVAIVAFLAFTSGSFDLVNIMTQGGPVNATTTLIYYTYYVAFDNVQLGYAAALAIVQLGIVVVFLSLALGAQRLANR